MAKAPATESSIRSATKSVRQVREALERLTHRLRSESGDVADGYAEALEEAASLTDQLLDLLETQGGAPGSSRGAVDDPGQDR